MSTLRRFPMVEEKFIDDANALEQVLISEGDSMATARPVEIDPVDDRHLLWLLLQVKNNLRLTNELRHEKLGFVRGALMAKGYLSVYTRST